LDGAEGGIRTPTRLPSLRPERSASTNSTTSAPSPSKDDKVGNDEDYWSQNQRKASSFLQYGV
jgi:hypothetical protein